MTLFFICIKRTILSLLSFLGIEKILRKFVTTPLGLHSFSHDWLAFCLVRLVMSTAGQACLTVLTPNDTSGLEHVCHYASLLLGRLAGSQLIINTNTDMIRMITATYFNWGWSPNRSARLPAYNPFGLVHFYLLGKLVGCEWRAEGMQHQWRWRLKENYGKWTWWRLCTRLRNFVNCQGT